MAGLRSTTSTRTSRTGRIVAAGLVLVVAFGGSAFASAGADGSASLAIRKIDSSLPPGAKGQAAAPKNVAVDFWWTGAQTDLSGLKLTQNGQDITPTAPAAALKADVAIALVIDSGPAMDTDGGLVNVRDTAKAFVRANPTVHFAVVQAGDKAIRAQDLSTDTEAIVQSIDSIGKTKGSAVWNALSIAGATLKANPEYQPNVMLVAADNDSVAPANEPVARTAVLSAGASVWAIERLGAMDPTPYDSLVGTAGGQVLTTDSGPKMGDLFTQAGTTITKQQYQLSYGPQDAGQAAEIALTVGGQTSNANILIGGVYQGGQALRPDVTTTKSLLPILDNKIFFLLACGLALLAAVGAAYAITSLFVRDDLSDMLQPYADFSDEAQLDDDDSMVKSALIQRAVSLTEQVADNQGLLTRAEGALERANLPLRAGEALFFYMVLIIVVTVLALLWQRSIVSGLIFGILAAIIPVTVVNYIGSSRRKKFMSQLPDTLSLLSGTLRAGYSLMQGVEAVSQEVSEPMGLELRRVITESRLGRPLEESLEASADRMDSPDFAWAVMAIGIQREVGGNLAELLMTVADTMIQRERLRRDVRSLTAEGRVSAYVLAGLPPGLGLIMWVLNPEYMSTLWSDGLGIAMLIAAGVSMLIGFLWMKKIITIEI